MPERKLASVLPDPVGAQISVFSPLEIASQPPVCAGVGPSNEDSNQRRTLGAKGASGSGDSTAAFRLVANRPILRGRCPGPRYRSRGYGYLEGLLPAGGGIAAPRRGLAHLLDPAVDRPDPDRAAGPARLRRLDPERPDRRAGADRGR